MKIDDIKTASLSACQEFNVRRLDVFGSTGRDSATSMSDVDLLVEFNQPDQSPARRFFGLLHHLEDVLGCRVDLLTVGSLRNPYFKERVMKERIPLYEG